ncbi:5,6-dimethylbenzimidazole synthase [Methylomonas sp. AM2-LC]|uniref:5,6-dimethylbenzimidazole synthase n=1 Tax=Methylomonas sp. AM2-LC TaxID=3153301 RepID=UPI00326720AF
MSSLRYSDSEIAAIYRVIAERRDMRHFKPDAVDPIILAKLLAAAHHAPSVGLMQPWRFIRITDANLRQHIYDLVQEERLNTAQALGEREDEFMRLKVEGIMQCAEVLVVALCDQRQDYIFGRRTLPEMDLASVSCAIQNLWLAARAEGLGLGWVSMFEPESLAKLLQMPADAKPVAILCLGHVDAFYQAPMLVETGWSKEKPLSELVSENTWKRD